MKLLDMLKSVIFDGEADHLSDNSHFRCYVVSRDTYESADIGDPYQDGVVVEGFRRHDDFILVVASDE